MAARVLKLGTRRSALARAQSAAVALRLMERHPGLDITLVGIDTRGDRILDKPLSSIEGKEFFTAEIDQALLAGDVDLTVHSYKDLSLDRTPQLLLAAIPAREPPFDIALFAPDVPQRLAAGEALRIGTSSPRRMTFVPEFLNRVLPHAAVAPRVQLVELRGNVDSRLRRLHETRGSARHLDGIVLAFAGLARLWADAAGQQLLRELLSPLPRMVLPLSACPSAPAQGALAIECRSSDSETAHLLAAIDHPPTRQAVRAERALLAERGGGCHQRLGATQIDFEELGTLFYQRDVDSTGNALPAAPPLWTPLQPLPAVAGPVHAWDGSQSPAVGTTALPEATAPLIAGLQRGGALFVTHRRALPDAAVPAAREMHVWVPGVRTWEALAARGVWVEGCADGLGLAAVNGLIAQPMLQLPPLSEWSVVTHAEAAPNWQQGRLAVGRVIATYRHQDDDASGTQGPGVDVSHVWWHSVAQFERWSGKLPAGVHHACGAGRTADHLRRAPVQNRQVFPEVTLWRQWLGV
jgi:hydroxymethylbilane synthase